MAYGSDPAPVLAVLAQAAGGTPGVAQEPAPTILMTGYGDSALNFVVQAWTADIGNWTQVRSDLLGRILAALDAAAIAIPYLRIDVNLSKPESE